MQSDQSRDELGRDAIEINTELAHGNVSTQVVLVNTAKGTEEITGGRPHPFDRVGVDFADTVAIVIACPFVLAMAHRGMTPNDVVVAAPFIGKDARSCLSELVNMLTQGWLIGMVNDAQSNLAGFSSDGAHNGWAIVLVRSMSALFVGTWPRRVGGIKMRVTFFPPRSETSHRFQSVCRIRALSAAVSPH